MSVLRLPLQVRNGRFVTVPFGSEADVSQSVALLADTRVGERRSVPDYGIEGPTFEVEGLREDEIRDAIDEWEPRADVLDISITTKADGSEDVSVLTQPYFDEETD